MNDVVMQMTTQELAEEAAARGFSLGKNPVRTIRYYTSIGLLRRPDVQSVGKARRSRYTSDHLAALAMIDWYKARGHSLSEIKGLLGQPLYWSEAALDFMRPIIEAKSFPQSAFRQGVPVTREGMAVFLVEAMEAMSEGHITWDLLESAFLDRDGRPGIPFSMRS
jgi:DNA-binding transcriptional MerR regulator